MSVFFNDDSLITKLAYAKWEEAGSPSGRPKEKSTQDYLDAEKEVKDAISRNDTQYLALLIWRAEGCGEADNFRKAERLIKISQQAEASREKVKEIFSGFNKAKNDAQRCKNQLSDLKNKADSVSTAKKVMRFGSFLPCVGPIFQVVNGGTTIYKAYNGYQYHQMAQELRSHVDTMNGSLNALNQSLLNEDYSFFDQDMLYHFASELGLDVSDIGEHISDGLHHISELMLDWTDHAKDFIADIDWSDFVLDPDIFF